MTPSTVAHFPTPTATTLADRAEAHRAAGRAIGEEAVADVQRTLVAFLDAVRQASLIDTVPVGIRELATRWEVEALERVVTLSSIAGRVK